MSLFLVYVFVDGDNVGCVGFGWTYCAKGGSLISRRDAIISIQSHCTIFLPCRTLSVYSIFMVNGSVRIILFITFSFLGMQLVAQTNSLTPRLFGIIVAS